MNKKDLANKFSVRTGLNVEESQKLVETLCEEIMRALSNKESIYIRGFGTFSSVYRDEKVGRVVKTGERVIIPSCIAPKFKPSKKFKERVNKKCKK